MRDYKVGDKVTIIAEVVELDYTNKDLPIRVEFPGTDVNLWPHRYVIATHTPKPAPPRKFKPGDLVTWGAGAVNYEISEINYEPRTTALVNRSTLFALSVLGLIKAVDVVTWDSERSGYGMYRINLVLGTANLFNYPHPIALNVLRLVKAVDEQQPEKPREFKPGDLVTGGAGAATPPPPTDRGGLFG